MLIGAVAYHQYSQDNHYQEQLRAACAAKGGKTHAHQPLHQYEWTDPALSFVAPLVATAIVKKILEVASEPPHTKPDPILGCQISF